MCRHDPLYRIENETYGGEGCPLCHAERRKAIVPPAGKCQTCGRDLTEEIPADTTCPDCARRWWNGIEEIKF